MLKYAEDHLFCFPGLPSLPTICTEWKQGQQLEAWSLAYCPCEPLVRSSKKWSVISLKSRYLLPIGFNLTQTMNGLYKELNHLFRY